MQLAEMSVDLAAARFMTSHWASLSETQGPIQATLAKMFRAKYYHRAESRPA
jgi:hypothetical protein